MLLEILRICLPCTAWALTVFLSSFVQWKFGSLSNVAWFFGSFFILFCPSVAISWICLDWHTIKDDINERRIAKHLRDQKELNDIQIEMDRFEAEREYKLKLRS